MDNGDSHIQYYYFKEGYTQELLNVLQDKDGITLR